MTRSPWLEDRAVKLSNPQKVLFPAAGLTKADLIDYYRRVAPVMLPHLAGRPLSFERYPDGIAAEGFMQKNASDYFPSWIRRVRLAKQDGVVDHVVAEDAATLIYLANQACITFHVWLSRIDRVDHPDRMVLDLDPSDDDFAKVRWAAREARALLEELGLAPFLQVTGSRGLHIWVPLDRSADFDQVRAVRLRGGGTAGRAPAQGTDHRAAQGQARRSRVRRCGAQRLRPDRGGALFGARAPAGADRDADRVGRAGGSPSSDRSATRSATSFAGSRASATPGPRSSATRVRCMRRRSVWRRSPADPATPAARRGRWS